MENQEQEVAVYVDNIPFISNDEQMLLADYLPLARAIFATTLAEDGNYRFNKDEKLKVIGLTSNYDKNIDWLRANYSLHTRQYRDYAVDCDVIPARADNHFLHCEPSGAGSTKLVIEKDNRFFQCYTNKGAFFMPNTQFKDWVESMFAKSQDSNFANWKGVCDNQYYAHRWDR